MNINHERLVPGAITYWGDVVGDIMDQKDLVDYVDSHGVTQESFNNHEEQNAADFNTVNDRLTTLEHGKLDSQLYAEHVISNIQSFVALDNRVTALEQGGGSGGGGVTPDEFNDHKAQNDASFKEAFDRITALEQNPGGVSREQFEAHADQNNAQFQAIDNQFKEIDNQFQNYATRDYANQLYQSSIDLINQSVSGLGESIDELRSDLNNKAVTTQQCDDPGLTDYILTSLVWIGSPAILAMDDYYTGDNAENRDVTIWGSYIENDRFKFGKVETTYELNQETHEYTVTGQTFSEMIAAEAPDTSTDATYVLKATVLNGQVTYSWVPENAN